MSRQAMTGEPTVPVEWIVSAKVGQLVFRSTFNSLLGSWAIIMSLALGVGMWVKHEERLSILANVALGVIGLIVLGDGVRAGMRASLRPRYGLRGASLVVCDRRHPWHSLVALQDVEEVSLTLIDAIAEVHSVSLRHNGQWTTIGPFEKAISWAELVATRAGEAGGREVRLNT